MTNPLRLQRRDDPLALSTPQPANEQDMGDTPPAAPSQEPDATRPPATRRRRATRRPPPAITPSPATPTDRTYDDDRLEQTGWRIYDSLLAEVRTRAEQLSAAGIPTSAAALAAATLHSHLPHTIEEGADIMRAYRQATAGRQRAHRHA
jgi:hypothetical protein